jgi:hypothetical protein
MILSISTHVLAQSSCTPASFLHPVRWLPIWLLAAASPLLAQPLAGGGLQQTAVPAAAPVTTQSDADLLARHNRSTRPLLLMENRGQITDQHGQPRRDVLFLGRSEGVKVLVLPTGLSYQFEKHPEGPVLKPGERPDEERKAAKPQKAKSYRVDMRLLGANPAPQVVRGDKNAYFENYYNLPHAPEGIAGVAAYEQVTLKDVYPGIDWVLYTQGERMKYDFVVHPGADPGQIQMQYSGAEALRLTAEGGLRVRTPLGELTEQAPVSFCEDQPVASHFVLSQKEGIISFTVGTYDPQQVLTIDPQLLWGTYYGGTGNEYGRSVSADASGNVYLGGYTGSTTNIATAGTHQTTLGGSIDAFVAKFSATGARLWGTYYGGTSTDVGYSVSADASGNVYLGGNTTSTTNMATAGAHQTTLGGSNDAFVAKFSATGTRLWSTYYGGTGYDYGNSVSADASGNVYLEGYTTSTTNMATAGAHQTTNGGSNDAFVAKFSATGTQLWGTYYGGTGYDIGHSVSVDASGNVYLGGETESTTNIATAGAHQTTFSGGGSLDAFVAKFSATGTRLWGTYYGGTSGDVGYSVSADASGNVYLGGYTESTTNIASAGAHQTTNGGSGDAFVAKFSDPGTRLWGTYYGGTGTDAGYSVSPDASGNVYLGGETNSTTNIASAGAYQTTFGGSIDAYLAKFSATGTRLWGTYYGGTGSDFVNSVSVDASGNVYLGGETTSTTNIASAGAHQTTYGGGSDDAFVAKLGDPISGLSYTTPTAVYCVGTAISPNTVATITGTAPFTYTVSPALPTGLSLDGTTGAISGTPTVATAAANYTVTATNSDGSTSATISITVNAAPTFTTCPAAPVTATTAAGTCMAAVSYTVTAAGSPAPTLTYAFAGATPGSGSGTGSGATFNLGSTTVMVTATNGCGTATCLFNVTVVDNQPPVLTCPADIVQPNSLNQCGRTVGYGHTLSDNCASPVLTYTMSGAVTGSGAGSGSSTYFPVGTTTVVLNATDGTNAVQCSFMVTINDTQLPAITCPASIVQPNSLNQCGRTVAYGHSLSDNCASPVLTYTMSGAVTGSGAGSGSSTYFPVGTTTVVLNATDGTNAVQCSFMVTINDTQLPGISCPASVSVSNTPGQCGATVIYATPTASDNCSGVGLDYISGGLSGSFFDIGTTTVEWQATDAANNTKTCTFSVTVSDVQAPSISCPAQQTRNTDANACTAATTYADPVVSDNCNTPLPTIDYNLSGATTTAGYVAGTGSGSTFNKGITTVTLRATDMGGLTRSCTFRVIVLDAQPPVITCPPSQSVNTAATSCTSAAVTYATPTATDNCTPAPTVTRTSGPASGSAFPAGTTNVVWRATDASGRTATCSFSVTVTDNTPPVITCPGSVAVSGVGNPCSVYVTYATPTATDNCGTPTLFLQSGLSSGSNFPAGTTVNVFRATDARGTTATCSFSVTVTCSGAANKGAAERGAMKDAEATFDFTLSPNPAQQQVLVSLTALPETLKGQLLVYDAQGRLYQQQALTAGTQSVLLPVEAWPAGLYWISVQAGAAKATKRLAVQRF